MRIPAPVAAKVPEITVGFWVVKVLTTGMGEACSDWLGGIDLALAGVVGLGGLALTLWLQLRTREYRAPVYWSAVALVAVFGTELADVLHVGLAIPYAVTTALWALVVAALFVAWRRSEGTLDIHSITTTRRELLYWATVLATFALGTAAGDLTATELGLGFFASGLLFLGLIAVPLVLWRVRVLGPVAAFWTAYVLTRPLGASFADWLGKPHDVGGGLGLGDGTVTGVAALLIVVGVGFLAARRNDVQAAVVGQRGDEVRA